MLKMMKKADFIEREGDLVVLGDKAMEIANVFSSEVRRPLQGGLVSSKETDALEILSTMIRNLLGEPRVDNEYCYYSVPAEPVDDPSRDVVYHQKILGTIIEKCGYTPVPSNEAMAIIFSDCQEEDFSGLSLSFGSGMTNVALAYNTLEAYTFSIAMGGDFIDTRAATQVGANTSPSRMCAIKEKGLDLSNPVGREQEALFIYYEHLIKTVLAHFVRKFEEIGDKFFFPNPIPIVVSGGTSMAKGFVPLFQSVFEKNRKDFPIQISEIRHAERPLMAVAQGLYIQAAQEYTD